MAWEPDNDLMAILLGPLACGNRMLGFCGCGDSIPRSLPHLSGEVVRDEVVRGRDEVVRGRDTFLWAAGITPTVQTLEVGVVTRGDNCLLV